MTERSDTTCAKLEVRSWAVASSAGGRLSARLRRRASIAGSSSIPDERRRLPRREPVFARIRRMGEGLRLRTGEAGKAGLVAFFSGEREAAASDLAVAMMDDVAAWCDLSVSTRPARRHILSSR